MGYRYDGHIWHTKMVGMLSVGIWNVGIVIKIGMVD
jgi:hypothetical protein